MSRLLIESSDESLRIETKRPYGRQDKIER
nr:MAG TPA: hypothetical protein [Bacteriophage sp.]